jgi:hypothetical protein
MGRRLKTYGICVDFGTIPTAAGNTDKLIIIPKSGVISGVYFSGNDALATSDTNYITWVITNLGQAGSGTAAPLATSPAGVNTTKATGGAAIAANTKKTLTLSATASDVAVVEGDRVRVRITGTGTLANTETLSNLLILIDANGQ